VVWCKDSLAWLAHETVLLPRVRMYVRDAMSQRAEIYNGIQ